MSTWPRNSRRTAVPCNRCGALYTEHEPGGGPCPAHECEGFQWIDPEPDEITQARDRVLRSS